ncbi:GNAT family N-acetyltransferase [Bradyrhizobium sp. AUGA SZCCT0169]|uniref:GNAT family N-acetyltransferase n=1 Tax=Bradyrhizobium sp. AUGA SZCCT0169 TaxID=2807663 RepID=UPI00390C4F39
MINHSLLRASISNRLPLRPVESQALKFLLPLSDDYPNIENWFEQTVVPGLREGTRTLICVERNGGIVGVGIGKNDLSEKKICTVRVCPSYFGRGIGLRLFDALLHWVGTDQPHLTVSQAKLPAFDRIFERYRFRYSSSLVGRYIPGKTEISYNEASLLAQSPASNLSTSSSISKPFVTNPINIGTPRFVA